MICVEVHSNNVLALRSDTLSNAVSDSIKHETIKFLFPDNWNNYQKTAVFSAVGVEPINVLLCEENQLCLSKDECYIPFEVLKGDCFEVSVFGVLDETLATTTKEQIEVLQSGYTLGDQPSEPTQSEYSQILQMVIDTKQIAQSVRDDADNGVFKGEKGEKGDKGEEYSLTDADKAEIVQEVESKIENLETDVETIKQGYVTLDYIENTYPDAQTVDRRIAEYDLTVQETYATKKYVDDAVASGGVSQEYVDNAIDSLEDDIGYLHEHYATTQYVDEAVASVSVGVSQEYVDNAIAGVKDIADNNESDIEVIRQQTGTLQNKVQGLEDDVDELKQSSVTIGYVQETYATKNETASLEDDIGYLHEHYATKQYVDDAVASSGGGVSSWNDLTDKPFYEETTVFNEPLNITWDGNTEGLVSVDDAFFKVSDLVLTDEQIKTATVTFSTGNAIYIGDIWEDMVSNGMVAEDFVVLPELLVVFVRKDNLEIAGLTFTQKGIYFMSYNGMYVTSFTTTEPVEQTKTVLKKLDKKFLPDEPIEFIVNEDETSVSCKLSAEELLNISVTELHRNSVLCKEEGVRISPQSVTTGNLTTAFGTHTVITFVDTYCGSSTGYQIPPVYVVINQNGELFYIGEQES